MIKQIMIPVAAFAITVTGASAFNSDMLSKIDVDLTSSQVSALEQADQIRQTARDEAQQVLSDAGIDDEKMKEIRDVTREVRDTQHEAVKTAVDNDDYDAFLTAIADSPLADAINSEADFETFKEAQQLRESGDHEGAQELMSELGIEKPAGHGPRGDEMGGEHGPRGDHEGGPRGDQATE